MGDALKANKVGGENEGVFFGETLDRLTASRNPRDAALKSVQIARI